MADQNGVGTIGIEFAIGLVGDLEWRKIDAAIELQRLVHAEQRQQRTRMVRLMRALVGMDRRTWDRLHFYHLATDLLRGFREPPRKSGHKKPGLNISSTGITSVPGLFSELFNVAASRPAQMTTGQANSSSRGSIRQDKPRVNERPDRWLPGGLATFSLLLATVLPNQCPLSTGRPCFL